MPTSISILPTQKRCTMQPLSGSLQDTFQLGTDRQTHAHTQTHTRTLQDTFQLVTLLVAVISSPVLIWHSVRLKKQCHKAKSVSNGDHRGNGECMHATSCRRHAYVVSWLFMCLTSEPLYLTVSLRLQPVVEIIVRPVLLALEKSSLSLCLLHVRVSLSHVGACAQFNRRKAGLGHLSKTRELWLLPRFRHHGR